MSEKKKTLKAFSRSSKSVYCRSEKCFDKFERKANDSDTQG